MFSALKYNGMIWVCGGVSSPNGKPLGDLWHTSVSPVKWGKAGEGPPGSRMPLRQEWPLLVRDSSSFSGRERSLEQTGTQRITCAG